MTRLLIAFTLVAALAGVGMAQMSGAYTVDPNGTGSRNFTSMSAAMGALAAGVSGPVAIDVKPATYKGLLVITPVTGVSSVNTISFTCKGSTPAIIDANGSSVGILAFGPKWFRFTNFKITNATNYAIYMFDLKSPGPQNNIFTKCDFEVPAASSSLLRAAYFQYCYDNTFIQCRFAGGYYTLYHSQCSRNTYDGCEFDGKNTANYCIYLINNNDSDNLFQNCFLHDCRSSGYGVYTNASQHGVMFWNNTVIVNTSNSAVWAGSCCGWSRANSFRNNIFVNMGAGTAMKYGCSTTVLDYNDFDYNCYYAPNSTKGAVELERQIGSLSFTAGSLASWKTFYNTNKSTILPGGTGAPTAAQAAWDQNSIEGDPGLISLKAPLDIHLKSTSPLVDAGTTKYVIGPWISFPAKSTVATDFEGDGRGTLPDIGADEVAVRITASGSPTPGGKVDFALSSGQDPTRTYQCASSFGNGPTPLGNRALPLTLDDLVKLSTSGNIPWIFVNYNGKLDQNGAGKATLAIPNIGALKGQRIYTAFVTLNGSAPFGIQNISNSVLISIQ